MEPQPVVESDPVQPSNSSSPERLVEPSPPPIIPVIDNVTDFPSEAEEDGFELEGTFPFMEDRDDLNLEFFDNNFVVAPPCKYGISQTTSSISKPDCGASKKLRIEGKEAVEEGSQWTMDALLSRKRNV